MKDYCSLQFRGLSYFIWIIGIVVLTRDVVCYSEVFIPEYGVPCVPGQEGWTDMILQWMPEELKNPDSICEDRLGSGSSLCQEEYNGNYSSICGGMWCRDPLLETCTRVSTSDGVQCGDQKWCSRGECRDSGQVTVTNTSESCPFGDSSTFSSGGLSCQELVSRTRRSCYDVTTEQNCCQSCQAVRMTRQGCRYGDWIDGCREEECRLMTGEQLGTCCQTCEFYIIVVPSEQPSTTPVTPPSPRTTPVQQTTASGQPTTSRQQIRSTTPGTGPTPRTPGTTRQGGPSPTTSVVQPRTTPSSQTTSVVQPQTTLSSQAPQSQTSSRTTQTTSTESPTATTSVPVVTSSQQTTRGPTSQAPDSSSQVQTTVTNLGGSSDTQQANQNAVTIGTSAGVGAAVLIIIVIIVVYVIRKRVMTSQLQRGNSPDDNESVGGNSFSDLTANMTASSTTWYPNYRATHTMSPE